MQNYIELVIDSTVMAILSVGLGCIAFVIISFFIILYEETIIGGNPWKTFLTFILPKKKDR